MNLKQSIFLFTALTLGLSACKTNKAVIDRNSDLGNIKMDVEILSADDMEGRETGTPGEKKAAKYITKRMVEIGLDPGGTSDGYIQRFSKTIRANPHADKPSADDEKVSGYNILGLLDKGAPFTAVIGAHYDHLGYGDEGSLYVGERAIHNGADDNASGIAGMLRIAEELIADTDSTMNYLFIAFSGEEKGLWGSNYFTKHPTVPLENVNYMINMDMIGRLNKDRQLAIYGTGTTPSWEKALAVERSNSFKIKEEASGVGPTDHTSFYLEDLPVLQFFTGQHEDYTAHLMMHT